MKIYNARVIGYSQCPDCGNDVLRCEGLKADGSPRGAIECAECGFASLNGDGDPEQVALDFAAICERVGHEYMPMHVSLFDKPILQCVWCGKRILP